MDDSPVDLAALASLEAFETAAEARLPPHARTLIQEGAGASRAMRANVEAWRQWRIRTRVLRDVARPDLSVTVLGERVAAPLLIAPSGLHGLSHPDGEFATATAAAAADTIRHGHGRPRQPLEGRPRHCRHGGTDCLAMTSLQGIRRTPMKPLCLIVLVLSAVAPAEAPAKPLVVAQNNHVGLVVQDLAAEALWYRKAFGLAEIASHRPTPAIRTVLLRAPNGLQLELVQAAGSRREHHFKTAVESTAVQGYGHWAVDVDDVARAYADLLAAGAASAKPPADGPGGARFAYIKDPEGNLIELIENR